MIRDCGRPQRSRLAYFFAHKVGPKAVCDLSGRHGFWRKLQRRNGAAALHDCDQEHPTAPSLSNNPNCHSHGADEKEKKETLTQKTRPTLSSLTNFGKSFGMYWWKKKQKKSKKKRKRERKKKRDHGISPGYEWDSIQVVRVPLSKGNPDEIMSCHSLYKSEEFFKPPPAHFYSSGGRAAIPVMIYPPWSSKGFSFVVCWERTANTFASNVGERKQVGQPVLR